MHVPSYRWTPEQPQYVYATPPTARLPFQKEPDKPTGNGPRHGTAGRIRILDQQHHRWASPGYSRSRRHLRASRRKCSTRNASISLLRCRLRSELDLRSTNVVQHRIVIGEDRPSRQPQRPLPVTMRRIIDEQLDKFFANGTVKPCQSESASNVVIFRKKDGSAKFCVDSGTNFGVQAFDKRKYLAFSLNVKRNPR